MRSGETIGNNTGESFGEAPNQTYEQRGERSLEAANLEDLKAMFNYAQKFGLLDEQKAAEIESKIHEIESLNKQEQEILSGNSANTSGESTGSRTIEITEISDGAAPESVTSTPESDRSRAELVNETIDKAKNKPGIKKLLAGAAIVVAAAAIAFSAVSVLNQNKAPQASDPIETTTEAPAEEQDDDVGENKEQIKVSYDYSHWSDFEHKSSHNAYDYDYSDCYGDEEKTKEGWLEVAGRTPEALASYAYYAFTDAEKDALGISGMNPTEIDDYMSDKNNPDAGPMQQRLLKALEHFAENDAIYEYEIENDTEKSAYIFWVDENGDLEMTPEEMHLGYDNVDRNNAKQANIYREIDGQKVKVLDLNLYCGFQVDEELDKDIPGLPRIKEKDPGGPGDSTIPKDPGTRIPEDPGNPPDNPPENPPDNPPENPPDNPPDNPPEKIEPKDNENLERIDKKINEDIAKDIGTEEVKVTPTPTEEVEKQTPTEKPAPEVYDGTEPVIVENPSAEKAEPVQEQVSPENDYSQDRGGANSGEYAPVQDDQHGQEAADQAAIPVEQAPTGGQELEDILGDLGIE